MSRCFFHDLGNPHFEKEFSRRFSVSVKNVLFNVPSSTIYVSDVGFSLSLLNLVTRAKETSLRDILSVYDVSCSFPNIIRDSRLPVLLHVRVMLLIFYAHLFIRNFM